MALAFALLALAFLFFNLIHLASSYSEKGLRYDFYDKTCPNVERIIFNEVAVVLRSFFHDCFVEDRPFYCLFHGIFILQSIVVATYDVLIHGGL